MFLFLLFLLFYLYYLFIDNNSSSKPPRRVQSTLSRLQDNGAMGLHRHRNSHGHRHRHLHTHETMPMTRTLGHNHRSELTASLLNGKEEEGGQEGPTASHRSSMAPRLRCLTAAHASPNQSFLADHCCCPAHNR
jgi:hypothetical protein